jgi:hypothetical protein
VAASQWSVKTLLPAEGITKLAFLEDKFRRNAGAPGVIATHAHMERIKVEPTSRLFPQQMMMGCLTQLLLAVAAR